MSRERKEGKCISERKVFAYIYGTTTVVAEQKKNSIHDTINGLRLTNYLEKPNLSKTNFSITWTRSASFRRIVCVVIRRIILYYIIASSLYIYYCINLLCFVTLLNVIRTFHLIGYIIICNLSFHISLVNLMKWYIHKILFSIIAFRTLRRSKC